MQIRGKGKGKMQDRHSKLSVPLHALVMLRPREQKYRSSQMAELIKQVHLKKKKANLKFVKPTQERLKDNGNKIIVNTQKYSQKRKARNLAKWHIGALGC